MKSLHLYLKKIAIISFIIFFFNCTNPKIELENAQSQNIEFLIEQATNLWEKRSDTNAVKQANYFLGLAYNVKKTSTEITDLYIKCLFFQGMFLEGDNDKKDSLFLRGSEVAKNSILNNDIFIELVQNSSVGDSTFKILSALSEVPKELVPSMYWWATNKLWYLNTKPAIERINQRELLEVIMHRVISLEPNYDYGGAYRFFGVFYSRIPGVELSQSKTYFEKAISSNETYFGNQVQMSEFYYQKSEDKISFIEQLEYVKSLDASISNSNMAENLYYQKRANKLLLQQDTLFE
tara:strand:+ start:4195 stop:5073 length:879 start_codon:yes stop_codon:yes gene_type:complete